MYSCAGFYPEGFSLIARRNGTRGISFDRDHRYRFAAQLGPQLLLNAGKIAVEIDIQPAQGQRGNGVIIERHASLYDSGGQPSLPALNLRDGDGKTRFLFPRVRKTTVFRPSRKDQLSHFPVCKIRSTNSLRSLAMSAS